MHDHRAEFRLAGEALPEARMSEDVRRAMESKLRELVERESEASARLNTLLQLPEEQRGTQ